MAVESQSTPRTRRFTADEVWRMVEVGILRPDERLELIDGQLRLVSPSGFDHTYVVGSLNRRLSLAYGERWTVLVQNTVPADAYNLPEPDIAVLVTDGAWVRERRLSSTDETLLVVEVSVTTASVDQRKATLYAEAGAPVYWIVDVPRRCVFVHMGPRPDGTWNHTHQIAEGGSLDLPGIDASLSVADILPG